MQKVSKKINLNSKAKIRGQKESVINFRTKESVKKEASKIFDKMGLDMSSALNTFLHNVIIRKAMPMNLITENGYTIAREQEIIAAAKDILPKEYSSVKDLMNDLNN
jgi:DNA-damage-inducible protein J